MATEIASSSMTISSPTSNEEIKGRFRVNIEQLKSKDNSYFIKNVGNEYIIVTNPQKNEMKNVLNESKENDSSNTNINRRRSLHLSPHYFEELKTGDNSQKNKDNMNLSSAPTDESIKEEQMIRESELLWRSLLAKQPLIGKEILLELVKDYNIKANIKHDIVAKDFMYVSTPRVNENVNENKDDNNNNDMENIENIDKADLNKLGKWLSFWLSSIISRANEPYFIYSQLSKLEQIGINESNLQNFIEIINQQSEKYSKNNDKQLESLNNVLSKIQTLLVPPQCDKCNRRMERQIPKDIKPYKTPNVYGVYLSKMSRSDQVPFCKACQKSLENSDLAFVCSDCGPYGVIRIIRHGTLKGLLATKGNSLCLDCVYNGTKPPKESDSSSDNDQNSAQNSQ